VEAREGDRVLVLDAGHRNETFGDTGEHGHTSFERYQMVVDKARAAAAQANAPKTMSSMALIQAGSPAHLAELTWRVGLLFGAVNLTMLGIGMSATNPRRASNWNLLFALLTFIVYYNLLNLSQAWVGSGRLHMAPALAWLHGSAFLLACALIWWRDHATTLALPLQRRAGATR
jgi:lipopolysaccharide export system permease protein